MTQTGLGAPQLRMSDYSYELPDSKIAIHPLPERDASKLLVFNPTDNTICDAIFRDLPHHLPPNSLLVANTTRVIAARLRMRKPTGGEVEVLLIDPVHPSTNPADVLSSTQPSVWQCLIGGRNVSPEMVLTSALGGLTATVLSRDFTGAHVLLEWTEGTTLSQVMEAEGTVPLPPYLHREAEEEDIERYQTVYAEEEGSAAAPTAGLHFTDRVFGDLEERGIRRIGVTLHVGLGTFNPVQVTDARDHTMHAERFGITRSALESMAEHLRSGSPFVTAVGTTSVRTLESLHCLGARLLRVGNDGTMDVSQWEMFDENRRDVPRLQAIEAILTMMQERGIDSVWGETRLMIAPGCPIIMTDALITNFHQPGNTLLLLVAAFAGPQWTAVYNHALSAGYRFLSYGDSSLLFRYRG